MSEVLLARGVRKSYRTEGEDLAVLKGLDLEVKRGEVIAIVGVSGVGKSTLLHLLGGLDRPDEGEVRINGEPLANLPLERLAAIRNRFIGFVFQFHYLLPEFSAIENVMMPLLIRRSDPREAREKARGVLEELGLEGRLRHRPSSLSGGEQQRVAIARALVADPSVLLADEPTGNLDPGTGAIVFEIMRGLAKRRGMATIVATHNEFLASTCDRCMQLCEGKLRDVSLPLDGSRDPDDPGGLGSVLKPSGDEGRPAGS